MFGDLFSQRGPYTEGLFYGGRRRYLIDVGPDDKLSRKEAILLPPDLLKTPRQRRYTSRSKTASETKSFQFSFQAPKEDTDHTAIRRFKKGAQLVQKMNYTIEHFTSTNPADWIMKREAGVLLYINKNTGEVSTECPWAGDTTKPHVKFDMRASTGGNTSTTNNNNHKNTSSMKGNKNNNNIRGDNEQRKVTEEEEEVPEELGTGSLVYDHSDLEGLWEYLDSNGKIGNGTSVTTTATTSINTRGSTSNINNHNLNNSKQISQPISSSNNSHNNNNIIHKSSNNNNISVSNHNHNILHNRLNSNNRRKK